MFYQFLSELFEFTGFLSHLGKTLKNIKKRYVIFGLFLL